MRARPDVGCSIHLHTVPIMAIAAHPKGLRMLNIQSVPFYENVAYPPFGALAEGTDDQQQLIDDLGAKQVLLMRNHGAVITGRNVESAFVATQRFVAACEVQCRLEACGQGVEELSPEMCRRGKEQMLRHDQGRGGADWPAWLRRLDRIDPSFRS
jgi:ribulose-5-phosphate 4-epimerase/fuculose-1-phosphate aldolase